MGWFGVFSIAYPTKKENAPAPWTAPRRRSMIGERPPVPAQWRPLERRANHAICVFDSGARFEPERDRAAILDGTAQIVGVPTVEQAARQAERLCREGVDCIELCGAFGEAGARAVIAATHNQVPVGFVTHLPEQEELFRTTFGG